MGRRATGVGGWVGRPSASQCSVVRTGGGTHERNKALWSAGRGWAPTPQALPGCSVPSTEQPVAPPAGGPGTPCMRIFQPAFFSMETLHTPLKSHPHHDRALAGFQLSTAAWASRACPPPLAHPCPQGSAAPGERAQQGREPHYTRQNCICRLLGPTEQPCTLLQHRQAGAAATHLLSSTGVHNASASLCCCSSPGAPQS